MARIRTFKPDMASSHRLAVIPREVLYTWQQLWPQCDDKGRFHGAPRLIWAALYPLRDDVTPIALIAELEMLVAHERLCCYRGCDDKVWLHIIGWYHQKIDRPSESRIPPCRDHEPDDPCYLHPETRCASSAARFTDAEPVSTAGLQGASSTRETLAKSPDAGRFVLIGGDAPPIRETLASPPEPSMLDLGSSTGDLVPKSITASRSATPTSTTRRGTRIPDDFTVTAEMRAWAHAEGWTDPEINDVTAEFVDYWQALPGVRATKLDWVKTWRNRLRDQKRRRRPTRPTTDGKVAGGLEVARRLAGEGR